MSAVLSEWDKLLTPVTRYGSSDLSSEGDRRSAAPQLEGEAAELRRKLKYFFMSPCDKYHAKGRKPFKLGLQLLKIIIVTVQVPAQPSRWDSGWFSICILNHSCVNKTHLMSSTIGKDQFQYQEQNYRGCLESSDVVLALP